MKWYYQWSQSTSDTTEWKSKTNSINQPINQIFNQSVITQINIWNILDNQNKSVLEE